MFGLDTVQIWLIVLVLTLIWVIVAYVELRKMHAQMQKAWNDYATVSEERTKQTKQIVAFGRKYIKHEKSLIDKIAKFETDIPTEVNTEKRAALEEELTSALHSFFSVAESYEKLRIKPEYNEIHDKLIELEKEMKTHISYYNTIALTHNRLIVRFPKIYIAKFCNFQKANRLINTN